MPNASQAPGHTVSLRHKHGSPAPWEPSRIPGSREAATLPRGPRAPRPPVPHPVEPLPGAAGAQQAGRRQGGSGQTRQLEKARAAGIRPMARPGAAAQRRQECPARAQVASCPPPARPEPPRAGPGARAGGLSAWDAYCQAAPSAGSSGFSPLSQAAPAIRSSEIAAAFHAITSF